VKGPGREELLRALPPGSAALAHALLEAAERESFAVHAVGGPVRDLLLGRPLRDVDLIVEESAGRGAAELARAAAPSGAKLTAHDRFGTIRLESAEGEIDLATVRRESYAHPGALPAVAAGTLEDDLRRRDFTVNALAVPLSSAARKGRPAIVDLDEGLRDVEVRVLRVFHARSFHDDPTRALRAARLAARLGFSLSRGSRSALRDALRDGAFGRVSGERLRRELEKLFQDAEQGLDPAAALRLLAEWHVLPALEPGLSLPRSAIAPLRRLGRTIESPPWPRRRLRPWAAGLAVWLAPLEPGLRTRTLRRVAVRGELAQRIAGFPKAREGWLRALARARGRGAIDAVLGPLSEEEVFALHAEAAGATRRRILRHEAEDRPKRLPVDGEDLVALGLAGPAVGRALQRVRAAYLDGAVKDREDALALARELVRRKPAPPRRKSRSGADRPAERSPGAAAPSKSPEPGKD
jgi:tRNA nucleotidyltransferase (CCA-adding enzyme)